MVTLGILTVLTLNHINLAAGIHKAHQILPCAKVEIGVSEVPAGRRIHLNGCIDGVAYFYSGCSTHIEHAVRLRNILLGNE